jgi:hypothetical protein
MAPTPTHPRTHPRTHAPTHTPSHLPTQRLLFLRPQRTRHAISLRRLATSQMRTKMHDPEDLIELARFVQNADSHVKSIVCVVFYIALQCSLPCANGV